MADNLFGCITLESLGSGVPTDYQTLRVQHKDRVALDSIKKHPVFFFAVPKRFLRKLILDRVSRVGLRVCRLAALRKQLVIFLCSLAVSDVADIALNNLVIAFRVDIAD